MTSRRSFLYLIPAAGAALAGVEAGAQTPPPPMVDEKDPQAVSLGYVADAKRVDKAKFPKYAPPQHCAICQFYQGAAILPAAPCTIFAGKRVAGPGWCSAYVAKPS
ncbi:MAG: high-potential iron-sulfur protein [Pseudomonadota bacterium]|nr:high-potential iron-sulfur protein [Pseudomonadota bacterium]